MSSIYQRFIALCDEVKRKEAVTYGVNEIEPELLSVLGFIKTHPKFLNSFKKFMLELVNGSSLYPLEIVIFCMRELQWPEIREEANLEKGKTDDWRIISSMGNILAVYDFEWEDADMYEYYSKEASYSGSRTAILGE